MKKIFSNFLKELKELSWVNFLALFIAGIINSVGVTMFLQPVSLYDSGISGTSMFLDQITPEFLTLSLFLVLLNVPIFIFGFKKQGACFTVYSLFTVIIYSLSAWLITDVLPIDVSTSSPVAGNDLLLCAMFGGILSGIGSGLAVRFGGAMDGIEVLAVIFSKKLGITVGTFVMSYNLILYIICGIVVQSWTLPLYSIITYLCGLKTVDFIVYGIDKNKAAMIVTTKDQEVAAELSKTFRGLTIIPAKGYYSKTDRKIIYIVVNRFQVIKMKNIVHTIDDKAFITISDVTDIFKANIEK